MSADASPTVVNPVEHLLLGIPSEQHHKMRAPELIAQLDACCTLFEQPGLLQQEDVNTQVHTNVESVDELGESL